MNHRLETVLTERDSAQDACPERDNAQDACPQRGGAQEPRPQGEHLQDVRLERGRDMHVELPSAEGLLAGTLALMTGYAQRSSGIDNQRQEREQGTAHAELMARKIASNLNFLKTHPCLSLPFAAVLDNLQMLWTDICAAQAIQKPQATSMWHGVAASVQ